jgi:hypothetical protein
VDRRAIDRDGEAAWISLVLAPAGVSLDFDDPVVLGATRAVLGLEPVRALSTLIVERIRFAGALTADDVLSERLRSDPFARIFPGQLLEVAPGLIGRMPAPVGPGVQRYGGGNPWPWDRFT